MLPSTFEGEIMRKFVVTTLTACTIVGVSALPAGAAHKCAQTPSGEHQTNGNAADNSSWTKSAHGLNTANDNSDTIEPCSS